MAQRHRSVFLNGHLYSPNDAAKTAARLRKADIAIRRVHPLPILEHAIAIALYPAGIVLYHLPNYGYFALDRSRAVGREAERIHGGALAAAPQRRACESALAERLRATRINGAGLKVAFEGQRAGERMWILGTLVEFDHPAVASLSRYHTQPWASVRVGRRVERVALGDLHVCDSTAQLRRLVRAQAAAIRAERACDAAKLPDFYDLVTPRDGAHRPPLDQGAVKRAAAAQRRRR